MSIFIFASNLFLKKHFLYGFLAWMCEKVTKCEPYMGHRSPGGIYHFSQISKLLLYPWPLWATSVTQSHSPLPGTTHWCPRTFYVIISFTSVIVKFWKHSQIPYYQGILKLYLIFLYDHPKLRNHVLNTEKTIRDLFSCCFLLSSFKRIVFSAFKTHLLSSGWSYRKNKNSFRIPW